MASPYDITFLRLLMEQQLTEKPQAMRCLQVIDEQAQRGQPVNAAQVAVKMGLIDPQVAQRFDALARTELQRGAPPAGTGRFAAPGAGGPPPHPSGAFHRPGPPSGGHPRPSGGHPRPSGGHPRPSGALRRPPPPGQPSGQHRRPSGAVPRPPGTSPTGRHQPPAAQQPPTGQQPRPATGRQRPPGGASATGRQPAPTGAHPRSGRQGQASGRTAAFQDMGGDLAGVECGPKLGRGPVGTSYDGRRAGQPVVVKVLSRRFTQHEGLIDRLLAEARTFVGFRHPSLAGLAQVGSTEGRHVLVFERARGKPLSEVVAEKGPLAPSAALRVVYDVAQVLSEAPASCGDIRAEKIFFDGQRAQLVDLGLARAASLGAGHGAHGLPFGDPRYLAPEVMQEEQQQPSPAADVYALGVLCYFLVCGVLPFQGEAQEVLGKHLESPLPPPPQNVSFSTKIAALILRMTAKSPSQRIPDPSTVVTVITQLLEGKPLSLPPIAAEPGQPKVEVDEFDLNDLSDDEGEISADRWEATSKPMARHGSGEWDRRKIAAARGRGPQLAGMASDDNLSPIKAAIAEATGDRPASSRRMRVGKSGRVDSAASSRRSARQTAVSDRPSRRKGVDKKGLLRAVGGLSLVVAVMVGIALIPEPKPEPILKAETGEIWAPPPPPPLTAVEELEEQAQATESELEDYDQKVDSRIKNRRFKEALALSEGLPEALRASQAGASRVQLAETRIRTAADAETERHASLVRELIQTGQFERAKQQASRMDWVLDEQVVEQLKTEADQAYLDRHREAKDLEAVGAFNHRQADRWLRETLKGARWGQRSRIYSKGGLMLDYGEVTASVLADLLILHQDRHGPTPELVDLGRLGKAIKLNGAEGQVTLLAPLKFQRVVDAAIEFAIKDAVPADTQADLAICVGVDHRGRSGVGLSWGKFPLSLRPGRTERQSLPGVGLEGFQSQARYRLQLSVAQGESSTTYSGTLTNLVKQTVQQGSFTSEIAPQGYLAIVAKGVEVDLLGLEIRGVPDPSQFKPKQ